MTSIFRTAGAHSHNARAIEGLADLIAASSGVIIFDATELTDGVEDTFTTPSVFASGKVRVWLQGLMQRPGVDFDEGVGLDSIVMAVAPDADAELIVVYGTDGDTPLTFTQLTDTPAAYAGEAEKLVAVKLDETGLEFIDAPSGGSSGYNPDTPPVSPNAMDDEFDDTSGMSGAVNGLNGRWAWVNQGATTISYANGIATIIPPASATRNIRIIEQTKPAAQDFVIECKLGMSHRGINFAQMGVTLRDGVNGDMYFFDYGISNGNVGGIAVNIMTNVTTYSSTPLAGGVWHHNDFYIRITYVNSTSTYMFEISRDYNAWYRLGFLVDAVGVTKIGLAVDEESNTAHTKLHVHWFRRTA